MSLIGLFFGAILAHIGARLILEKSVGVQGGGSNSVQKPSFKEGVTSYIVGSLSLLFLIIGPLWLRYLLFVYVFADGSYRFAKVINRAGFFKANSVVRFYVVVLFIVQSIFLAFFFIVGEKYIPHNPVF